MNLIDEIHCIEVFHHRKLRLPKPSTSFEVREVTLIDEKNIHLPVEFMLITYDVS